MEVALKLLKIQLGISVDSRDQLLSTLLESIVSEMKNLHGIQMNLEEADDLLFLVDFAKYRYESKTDGRIPRDIQWRLHNLKVKRGGEFVE